jgi:hypothetical protein
MVFGRSQRGAEYPERIDPQNQAGRREGEPLEAGDVVQVERAPGAGDRQAGGNGGFGKGRGDVVTIQKVGLKPGLCDRTRLPSQVWLRQRRIVGGQKYLESPTRVSGARSAAACGYEADPVC